LPLTLNLEDKVQFKEGSYDPSLGYSKVGHVDQVKVTKSKTVEAPRRPTRKRLEPTWWRDFVNIESKDGRREGS